MRIRSFTAANMQDAMAQIRAVLGDDAIIISHQRIAGGVRVTAALDRASEPPAPARPVALPDAEPAPAHDFARRLAWHGLPERLAQRLARTAESLSAESPLMALAAALDGTFRFQPCGGGGKPLILIGPPGVGKTVTLAKLAARAQAGGQQPRLITADVLRAGGVAQLQVYADKLNCPLKVAESPADLARLVKAAKSAPVLIDMPGLNPFSEEEIDDLRPLLEEIDADIAAVLPAGGDAAELADAAQIFASLGATRLIASKLDGARRYGGVLAAAQAGGLALAEGGISPFIADGLAALGPLGLARLLMAADLPDAADAMPHKRVMP